MKRWIRSTTLAAAALLLANAACTGASGPLSTAKDPEGMRHHALLQETVGFYAVFLPPDYDAPENRERRYPLVVILHGMGSTEVRHGKLADTFGRKDAIYLAPRAPYPYHEVFLEGHRPGYSVWPEYPKSWEGPSFPEKEVDALHVDALYTEWIARTIADVRRRYRITGERAVVYGHSLGAGFAHRFAVEYPTLVKAYYGYAGYYGGFTTDHPEDSAHADILKQNGIFPLLAHNRNDEMVPVVQTENLLAYFERHGVPHAQYVLAEGDHHISDEDGARAAAFVHDWCCGRHANVK